MFAFLNKKKSICSIALVVILRMCVRLQLVILFDKSSFIREWYLVNDKPLVPKSILLLLHLVSESPALCPWCLGEIGITKSWNFEKLCFETRPPLKCLWSQILVLFDVLPLGWTQNVNTQKRGKTFFPLVVHVFPDNITKCNCLWLLSTFQADQLLQSHLYPPCGSLLPSLECFKVSFHDFFRNISCYNWNQ